MAGPRSRSRSFRLETTPRVKTTYDPDGNVDVTDYGEDSLGYTIESITDINTPTYQSLISSGFIVNQPMSYRNQTDRSLAGDYTWEYPDGSGGNLIGAGVNTVLNTMPWSSVSIKRGYGESQAIANIDSTPYEFMEDVFEIDEVLKLLRDPLSALKGLTREFGAYRRRLQRRKRYARSKALADAWTQYRFAIIPLIGSIENFIESLSTSFKFPKRRSSTGGFSSSDHSNKRGHYSNSGWHYYMDVYAQWNGRSGIVYELTNPLNDWRSVYGLRFKDIPVGLWNVVPLSFIVDRIFNVSNMLKGILNFLDPNINIIYGWKSSKELWGYSSRYTKRDPTPSNGYQTGSCAGGGHQNDDFKMARNPWAPSVLDTIPPVNVGGLISSVTFVVDSLALITQRLR